MKLRWREFLIALCMAVGLWYGITGSEKVETQIMVGVEYKGMPPGLVIRSGQVNTLQVRVRASAGVLRTRANRNNMFSLDLSSLKKGANEFIISPSKLSLQSGIEVIIALDISNSMLAQDVQPNRLERAKRLISRMVDQLQNDKVGMIVFAGDAFTQLPITNDYISAKMFLESISPALIKTCAAPNAISSYAVKMAVGKRSQPRSFLAQ